VRLKKSLVLVVYLIKKIKKITCACNRLKFEISLEV